MKELYLVGAVHGVSQANRGSFGPDMAFHEVAPPWNLLEEIGADSSTTVGLESVPYIKIEDATHEQFELAYARTQLYGLGFFDAVNELLARYGVPSVHLGDPKVESAVIRQRRTCAVTEHAEYRFPNGASMRQGALRDHAVAYTNYLNAFPWEEAIFNNLALHKPDIAIIGQAHARRLASDSALQRKLGIKVSDYAVVRPEPPTPGTGYSFFSSQPLTSELLNPDDPKRTESMDTLVFENEITRRRYAAFASGRTMPKNFKTPDFIGQFYISGHPAKSLFELHIEEIHDITFKGVIFDVLGNASVQGVMGDSSIAFKKQYDPSFSTKGANPSLYYRGNREQDGVIEGRYHESLAQIRGGFVFRMLEWQGRDTIRGLDPNYAKY